MENSEKKISSSLRVCDKAEETARHPQRSTLVLGQTDVRVFTKSRYNFMAKGRLERIGKLSEIQF